jgi:hypothetical protein
MLDLGDLIAGAAAPLREGDHTSLPGFPMRNGHWLVVIGQFAMINTTFEMEH